MDDYEAALHELGLLEEDDELETGRKKGRRIADWSAKNPRALDASTMAFIPVKNDTAIWLRKRGKAVKPKLTPQQRETLIRCFSLIDQDGGGSISTDELKEAFHFMEVKITDAELNKILKEVDRDGSGEIEYGEFVEVMTSSLRKTSGGDDDLVPDFATLATAYRRRKLLDAIETTDKKTRMATLDKAKRDYDETMQRRRLLLLNRPPPKALEKLENNEPLSPRHHEGETIFMTPSGVTSIKGALKDLAGANVGGPVHRQRFDTTVEPPRPHSSASVHRTMTGNKLRKQQLNQGPRFRPVSQQNYRGAEALNDDDDLTPMDFPRLPDHTYRWERVDSPVWEKTPGKVDHSWWPQDLNSALSYSRSRSNTPSKMFRSDSRMSERSRKAGSLRSRTPLQMSEAPGTPMGTRPSSRLSQASTANGYKDFRATPDHRMMMEMPGPPETRDLNISHFKSSSGFVSTADRLNRPMPRPRINAPKKPRQWVQPGVHFRRIPSGAPEYVSRNYFGVNEYAELIPSPGSTPPPSSRKRLSQYSYKNQNLAPQDNNAGRGANLVAADDRRRARPKRAGKRPPLKEEDSNVMPRYMSGWTHDSAPDDTGVDTLH